MGGEWLIVNHSSVECDGMLALSIFGVVEMEEDYKLAGRLPEEMEGSAAFPKIPGGHVLEGDTKRSKARSQVLEIYLRARESNRQHRLPRLALHAFGQQCHDGL